MPDSPPVLTDATRTKITMNQVAFNSLVREAHMLRGQNAIALAALKDASQHILSLGSNTTEIDKVIAELDRSL